MVNELVSFTTALHCAAKHKKYECPDFCRGHITIKTDWPCSAFNPLQRLGDDTVQEEGECGWKVLHGQSNPCIGHAEFTVIWPLNQSGHSYFFHFVEQRRSAEQSGYELSRKWVCVHTGPPAPHLLSTYHVNAELYGALRIVTKFGRHMAMLYLIWPLHASRGSAIASHPPYCAFDHIFGSSINLSPECVLSTNSSTFFVSIIIIFKPLFS
jgi:hypothetical protein